MGLTTSQVVFYFFSATIVFFAILTVTSKKILRAATFLLMVLLSISAIYFLLNYQFLGAVQITLYAGGIVVLIIFSILLTSHIGERLPRIGKWKFIGSLIASLIGLGVTLWVILNTNFGPIANAPVNVPMDTFGKALLSYDKGGYVLPFEVISLLLLAAMIGAIVIARKDPEDSQNNSDNPQNS